MESDRVPAKSGPAEMERKKIFVAYGFNDKDKPIAELVRRLVDALGFEFVDGHGLEGQKLDAEIQKAITASFALLALTTRREKLSGGDRYKTHDWVVEELQFARDRGLQAVEVREIGVEWSGGLHGNRGYTNLDRSDLSTCIVDLVEVLRRWRNEAEVPQTIRLRVAPEEVKQKLYVATSGGGQLICSYRLYTSDESEPWKPARLEVRAGGVFINLGSVPIGATVHLRVEHLPKKGAPRVWTPKEPVTLGDVPTVEFTKA